MTDLYAKCPCGSGKKIKFCCKDIITDIERIERMLQGEQRNAAIDKINKLLDKHPGRPALLTMKARVHLDQKQIPEANEAVQALLAAEPENPSGLALQAMLQSVEHKVKESLASLHHALRASEGVVSQTVYRAYLAICYNLIRINEHIAAYAHLLTLVAMTRGEDRTALQMLVQITSSDQLPAIFQGLVINTQAPDDATWKREFDIAIERYHQSDWTAAAVLFRDMNKRILDEPILLRNQAILDVWTCEKEEAIKAFRTYASIREVDIYDAVEAEACAQTLDTAADTDLIDLVRITQDIDDAESMSEKLLSLDSAKTLNIDGMQQPTDGPPPKGMYLLYDRPLPTGSDEDLPLDALPREICSLSLFGKETDKSARIQLIVAKDDQFESTVQQVNDALGVSVSADADSELLTKLHRIQHTLRPNFWVPESTQLEKMRSYQEAWHQHQIHHVWTTTPMSLLGGKSAKEAAGERKLRRKVLASVLNMEMWFDQQPIAVDFDQLRAELELPAVEKIDPSTVDVRRLSPSQIMRLTLEKVSAPDLGRLFESVSVRPNGKMLHRIGMEIIGRGDEMKAHVDFVEVRARLAETAPTSDESLEHLAAARDIAVAEGESPATWLISELDHRIQRQELDIAKRLITEIQTRYIKEPGIAQMFSQILSKYGLLPAGGAAPPGMAPAQLPTEVGAPSAAQPDAGVWTPDGSASAGPDQGEGESKLWIPGMD